MPDAASDTKSFTRWQQFQIGCMQYIGYGLVSLIGRTLRWENRGDHHLEQILSSGKRVIFVFWHGRILGATWCWRHRGIVVMTSMNFDGEYIARFIRMFGYGAARGSSSRGGLRALAEMARHLSRGRDAAFTVDGPRGPRYVAKLGPVLLARKTGAAIFCFHISARRYWQLGSWDHFQIPVPFSRAVLLQAGPIYVPAGADEDTVRVKHREMQSVLDQLRAEGDSYWGGIPEPPAAAGLGDLKDSL